VEPPFQCLTNTLQNRFVVLFEFLLKGFHKMFWIDDFLNVQSVSRIALPVLVSLPWQSFDHASGTFRHQERISAQAKLVRANPVARREGLDRSESANCFAKPVLPRDCQTNPSERAVSQ
jgi:hypothetical protein